LLHIIYYFIFFAGNLAVGPSPRYLINECAIEDTSFIFPDDGANFVDPFVLATGSLYRAYYRAYIHGEHIIPSKEQCTDWILSSEMFEDLHDTLNKEDMTLVSLFKLLFCNQFCICFVLVFIVFILKDDLHNTVFSHQIVWFASLKEFLQRHIKIKGRNAAKAQRWLAEKFTRQLEKIYENLATQKVKEDYHAIKYRHAPAFVRTIVDDIIDNVIKSKSKEMEGMVANVRNQVDSCISQ
jgi:hypothetical protein